LPISGVFEIMPEKRAILCFYRNQSPERIDITARQRYLLSGDICIGWERDRGIWGLL
jgi:hypothetical protein